MSLLRLIIMMFFATALLQAADDYSLTEDSKVHEGVPKGELIKADYVADEKSVFPGTGREYQLYIPAGLDRKKPAPYMVFQDGVLYNAPVVLDNLIAKKEIPAMIGIFIKPGVLPAAKPDALPRFNRSYEYDSVNDNYVRFLTKEFLPDIARKHELKLSKDANDHAIAGSSSGGIAAFVAAWERPDAFRRIFTSIGTYVGLRGGNNLPNLVRKVEPRPLRIFLQDGSNDQNIYGGNWFIANQDMLSALEWAGYDVNHAWGDGGHNQKHASAIFPDVMRWLWRDYPAPIKANPNRTSKSKVYEIVEEDSEWQLVSEGHEFTEGPAANDKGEVFFTDLKKSQILRVGVDGKVSVFAENTNAANGLMFGPDGRLFACADAAQQIVAYTPDGKASTVAEGFGSNDLCITREGSIYATDPAARKVWLITKSGEKRVVDEGSMTFPNGVILSPDQSLLYVCDTEGQYVTSYQIQGDGSLTRKQKYYDLELPDDSSSKADGMTVDMDGRLYVATAKGVQICDQAGRVNGIIPRPQNRWLANVCFGGANLDELYVTTADKVFKRKTKVKGVLSGLQAPLKPAAPKL